MTGKQFENAILQQGKLLRISDQTITRIVRLKNNIVATGVIIENCIFEEDVTFEQLDLNCGIVFSKCKFLKKLSIKNCIATKYDNSFNYVNSHLEFLSTTIERLFFSGNNQIQRGINIGKNSIINILKVETLICSKGGFSIIDSSINKTLDISNSKFQTDVSIRGNSEINTKIRFENIDVNSLVFTQATFNKDIHIWAGKINSLTFNDGIFHDDVSISAVPISDYLTIKRTEFKKSIVFKLWDETNQKQGKLTNIYIASGKFGEQFIINGENYEVDKLVLKISKQLEGALYFNSTNIVKAEISGDSHSSNIVFNHSNFKELIFDNFYNYSTLSIISAKSFGTNSILKIEHSNLGKMHLFNVFLNTFDKVYIFNSIFGYYGLICASDFGVFVPPISVKLCQ
ncbi:hypothetical protein [Myroides odoratimimus]|uniref:hypothetical protein n=1 Tax=Myroides odoratimimus TaxID=76832 RepID=UPI002DB66F94|nr:hypothetical protein [Myroides odoratimimus]MEC4028574.1 hypothetical protein [Myroides odoratimimus]